jgi:hypothetical protein
LEEAKRYVVTYQDIWPAGSEQYKPLPMAFYRNTSLKLGTGKVKESAEAYVYISVDPNCIHDMGENTLTITVDGVKCDYLGTASAPGNDYSGQTLYKYKVNAELSQNTRHTLKFLHDDDSTVIVLTYIELSVMN